MLYFKLTLSGYLYRHSFILLSWLFTIDKCVFVEQYFDFHFIYLPFHVCVDLAIKDALFLPQITGKILLRKE